MSIFSSFCAHFGIKTLIAVCGATLVALIGENILAYEILFILIAIDTVTGIAVAIKTGSFSSVKSFRGIKKILLFFLLIIASHQVVRYSGSFQFIEDGVVLYCAANELISILENIHQLGLPAPKWIVDKLEVYRATGKINNQ